MGFEWFFCGDSAATGIAEPAQYAKVASAPIHCYT
jgi:hypothetical protein